MLKKLILLLLFTTSYLAAAETIYAWGYGDLVVETLKIVKYMFSIGEFKDFWKFAVLISMISAVLMMLSPNPDFLKLPKIFILSMGIYTLFLVSKIDVYVDDKADNSNSGLVTGVPWAVGYPVALFSTLEYRLGATYETATSIPNGMKYSDSGFMTPVSIFSQATKHKIVTPYIFQNLNNYILECVMPDLENGYKDYKTLVEADNAWAYMGNTSPATFLLTTDISNNTTLVTCPQAYSTLNGLLNNYVGVSGDGMKNLGQSLGGMFSSAAVASQLGIANQFLVGSSKTASQVLLQTATLNTFSESFKNYAVMNGADVNNAAFHSAAASQAAAAQMIVSGILGSQYIPVIKGILTAIIIGLTPILALLMVTPMGFKMLVGYIMILSWLACWHFGDVILNHIITTKVQTALSSLGDVTFANKGLINATTTDYINMAASMYWTIPTIALLVVTGFSLSAFASLNNAMTTKLDRTASAVGGDMGKGNMNFGNVGHNTYSANSINAAASGTFGQNTRVDYSNTYTSGSSSNVMNGLSTTQGTQAFGGGLGGSWVNSALSQDLGKQYDFKEAVQSTTNIGGGRHQATSAGTIQATTEDGRSITANADSGNIYTKGSDGQLQLHSGKVNLMDNGKSIEAEYKDGKEFKRTVTDEQGNKTEATTMDNGVDKSFKWTSGQDSGSVVTGVYNARANTANITDGKINGSDLAKTDSGITTYSFGNSKSTTASEGTTFNNQKSDSIKLDNTEGNSQENSSTETDSKNKTLTVAGKAEAKGGFEIFGSGVSVSASTSLAGDVKSGYTDMSVDKNTNTVTMTNSKGETRSHSLSSSDIEQLQSNMAKLNSNSSGMNASRDMNASRVEEIANKGLANGQSLDEIFKNIVQNKDAYHSGSIAFTGNVNKNDIDNNMYIKPTNAPLDLVNQEIQRDDLDKRIEAGGKGQNAKKLKENVNNIKEAVNSTYSADGTVTNNSTGEVKSWTGYSGPDVGKLPSKADNVQPTKTSNVEVPNQQLNNQQLNNQPKADNVKTNKGDGHFKAEGSLENLEKVTEIMKPKGNSQKQVTPEVNDKK